MFDRKRPAPLSFPQDLCVALKPRGPGRIVINDDNLLFLASADQYVIHVTGLTRKR
jgi:hypothetical protein